MEVKNKVYPSKDQMRGFFETATDNEPIYMVNLLKFKDKAEYKDGRKTELTGREAYKIYAEFVKKHLQNIGGDLILHTDVTRMAVGQVEELWDVVAIAKWPSRQIMGENMVPNDPTYLEAYQHREAGLAGQLNIETKEIND